MSLRDDQEFELAKLRLQVELEEQRQRLVAEERNDERRLVPEVDERRSRLSLDKDSFIADCKRTELELYWQREKMEFETKRAREFAREAKNLNQAKLQSEVRERSRQYDLDLLRIEHNISIPVQTASRDYGFKLGLAVKYVPRFADSQVDFYLQAFGKAMLLHTFPRSKWLQLIHAQLIGRALKVFAELSVTECKDYEVLKRALLLAYARVPEFHCKDFRTLVKGSNKTYCTFTFRLSLILKSKLEGEDAFDVIERLREVVKYEQFTNCFAD